MRRWSLRCPLIILVLALILLGQGAVSSVLGGLCGDGVGPCSCGDTVISNTTLSGSDPVLKTPCPCHGLIVKSNVTLTIGGTIRHSTSQACTEPEVDLPSGILLEPGAAGVVLRIGRIAGFAFGITDFFGGVTGTQISRLQIVDSGLSSILLDGDRNVIESNVIEGSGIFGINVLGDGNTIRLNRTEGGDVFGIFVGGSGNTVSRNVAIRNGSDGFTIFGDHATVNQNQSSYNGGGGFGVNGVDHTLTLNIAAQNALDGYTVFAATSTFARNRSDYNGRPANGFGINDFTVGVGTGGTANTYTGNRCTGDGLGDSLPPGLCF